MPPSGDSPSQHLESFQVIENDLIQARVPLEAIFREDVPVDQSHVDELKRLIALESTEKGGTGQLQPILLGEVPGRSQFAVIDGFHRIPALEQLDRKYVLAAIRLDCSWEKVIDLRISAAQSHEVVKFSRVVEWVEDAWSMTQWSYFATTIQAFSFTFIKNAEYAVTGKRLGFSPEDAEEIRAWVRDKCARWNIGTSSVYHYLSAAAVADPQLIKSARENRAGHEPQEITPLQLHAIAQALPHQYEKQQLVAKLTVLNKLSIAKARALALEIFDSPSLADAVAKLEAIDINAINPARNLGRTLQRRKAAALSHELIRINSPQFLLQRLHDLASVINSDLSSGNIDDLGVELSESDIVILRSIGSTCLALVSQYAKDNSGDASDRNPLTAPDNQANYRFDTPTLSQSRQITPPEATSSPATRIDSAGHSSLESIEALETNIRLFIYEGGSLPEIQSDDEISALRRALLATSSKAVSKTRDCNARFIKVTNLLQNLEKTSHRRQGFQIKQSQ
jgi:uncharacterized ParB-like nuclease family protein